MCKLTPKEEAILRNLLDKEKGLVAAQLRIRVPTIDVHLSRIRRKRAACKKFLAQTEPYKRVLYPKRKGE
jgi:DNA-binding NarL/FixJ family response regulator